MTEKNAGNEEIEKEVKDIDGVRMEIYGEKEDGKLYLWVGVTDELPSKWLPTRHQDDPGQLVVDMCEIKSKYGRRGEEFCSKLFRHIASYLASRF